MNKSITKKLVLMAAIGLCGFMVHANMDYYRAVHERSQIAHTDASITQHKRPVAQLRSSKAGTVKGQTPGLNQPNQGQLSSNFLAKAPNAQQAQIKLPNIIGSVVSSTIGLPVGMYSIKADGLTPIKTNYRLNAANGGAAVDDKYFIAYLDQFEGMVFGAYTYVFDINTWDLINDNYEAPFNVTAECMTSDGNQVWGCFNNNFFDGYELGTLDVESMMRTGTVAYITEPYSAMACDNRDHLYGIYPDGRLMSIDKATGDEELLANTGLVSTFLTSAAYDNQSNTLFYATCTDTETALYAIDFTAGYAVSKVCDLEGEVCGMHIVAPLAEDGAPAAISDLSVDFELGSLIGKAQFTMPKSTFGGDVLAGNVDYKVLAGNDVLASGCASAGESVSVEITLPEAGQYKLVVVTSNSEGQSPKSNQVNQWFGPDAPFAPWGVVLTYESGLMKLKWEPVYVPQHNGYFDENEVVFTVSRIKNKVVEEVVAKQIKELSFEEAIEAPGSLTTYSYQVVASFMGSASDPEKSNTVVLGHIVPPYTNSFDTMDDFGVFSTIDANQDWDTWNFRDSGEAYMNYNMWNATDDWLVSAGIRFEKGKAYTFSLDVHGGNAENYTDLYEIKMGNSAKAEDLNTVVVEPTELRSEFFSTVTRTITVDQSGIYYIGIHCISPSNQNGMNVDNFVLGEPFSTAVAKAVENVKFVAQYDGSTAVDIKFTLPTLRISGEELGEIENITILRDTETVYTLEGPKAGDAVSCHDVCQEAGTYHYTIVVNNESGKGEAYEADVYVGLKVPASPVDCRLIESPGKPGHVVVSWTAPAENIDGDPLDPSLITYTVLDINQEIIAEGLTPDDAQGWEYDIPLGDEPQVMAIFYIFAFDEAGHNPRHGETPMTPVGTSYQMPFRESCAGTALHSIWTQDDGYWSVAASSESPRIIPIDNDEGMFFLDPYSHGTVSTLTSGKIHIIEAEGVGISFYYFATPYDDFTMTPVVVLPGNYIYDLTDEPVHTNVGEGWVRLWYSLVDYVGQDIQIGFRVNHAGCTNYLCLDNIEVKEFEPYDLGVVSLQVPIKINAGGRANVVPTIMNYGYADAENFTIELYADGQKVSEIPVQILEAGTQKAYPIEVEPSLFSEDSIAYLAKVVYSQDGDNQNNVSEIKSVEIVQPIYPSVTIEGTTEGSKISLSWETPLTEGTLIEVVDDLESYPFSIDEAGDYTFYDMDGGSTWDFWSIGQGGANFPGAGAPMAYALIDTDNFSADCKANLDGFAHSGSKVFVAFDCTTAVSNDWLVSPLLPGIAQTISFYARQWNSWFGTEMFEVYYSTTGNAVDDFIQVGDLMMAQTQWTEYSFDIPKGSTYFAIRNVSNIAFALMIDDLSYTTGTPSYNLLGYNIYRDGEKINSELINADANEFIDTVEDALKHSYNVTAVYPEGESKVSNTYQTGSTTVLKSLSNDVINISAINGRIVVEGAKNVAVYSIDGRIVAKQTGKASVAVEAGTYIVKADNKVAKLYVR